MSPERGNRPRPLTNTIDITPLSNIMQLSEQEREKETIAFLILSALPRMTCLQALQMVTTSRTILLHASSVLVLEQMSARLLDLEYRQPAARGFKKGLSEANFLFFLRQACT